MHAFSQLVISYSFLEALMMDGLNEALKRTLSSVYMVIKPQQRETLLSVLRTYDTVVVLPIGFGKSLFIHVLP